MKPRARYTFVLSLLPLALIASTAAAQEPVGAPPPDAKALVDAPKTSVAPPKVDKGTDVTSASVSAGGQVATGNSQLVAATVNSKFDMRRGANGFGAAVLGNYGDSATQGQPMHESAENLQGRVRYDRYLSDPLSVFAIATGRHDRFQGLAFRLNLDPGAKMLIVNTDPTQFWGEVGYDFQFDDRLSSALVPVDASGTPIPNAPLLPQTATDHSTRLFLGFNHAFNKDVTFTTGLEYLQSFIASTRYRLNYDALLAASVGGGLALGIGFSARYDHDPLPGKQDLDTATTLSLVYSFSDLPKH